jgi:cytochrome c oxidase subunit 4
MANLTTDQHTTDVEHHDDDAHHPSDWEYVKIAIILAILTAVEVAMFFLEDSIPDAGLYIGLTLLMVIKFFIVAAWFMHLKYDTPWFRYVFIAGLVLAVLVYAIFFFAFDLFGLG